MREIAWWRSSRLLQFNPAALAQHAGAFAWVLCDTNWRVRFWAVNTIVAMCGAAIAKHVRPS